MKHFVSIPSDIFVQKYTVFIHTHTHTHIVIICASEYISGHIKCSNFVCMSVPYIHTEVHIHTYTHTNTLTHTYSDYMCISIYQTYQMYYFVGRSVKNIHTKVHIIHTYTHKHTYIMYACHLQLHWLSSVVCIHLYTYTFINILFKVTYIILLIYVHCLMMTY